MADRRWGRPRGRWCVGTEELDEDEGKIRGISDLGMRIGEFGMRKSKIGKGPRQGRFFAAETQGMGAWDLEKG